MFKAISMVNYGGNYGIEESAADAIGNLRKAIRADGYKLTDVKGFVLTFKGEVLYSWGSGKGGARLEQKTLSKALLSIEQETAQRGEENISRNIPE